MNKKAFIVLSVEVLICFGPLLLLWMLAACLGVVNIFSLLPSGKVSWDMALFAGLILLGAIGILGVWYLMKFIVSIQPPALSGWAVLAVLVGIGVCLGFVADYALNSKLSGVEMIFLAPVGCAAHLLYLAWKKRQNIHS